MESDFRGIDFIVGKKDLTRLNYCRRGNFAVGKRRVNLVQRERNGF